MGPARGGSDTRGEGGRDGIGGRHPHRHDAQSFRTADAEEKPARAQTRAVPGINQATSRERQFGQRSEVQQRIKVQP